MAENNHHALPAKAKLFTPASLNDPDYDPENLLDKVIQTLNVKNDAALCRALQVEPPLISKVRNRKSPVGAALLIRIHEVSNISIKDLRLSMFKKR